MQLNSMTGFGSADGAGNSGQWIWDLKSVNGRGLDIRVRLPPGFESLEKDVRERLAQHVSRGNVSVSLTFKPAERSVGVRLDEQVLETIIETAEALRTRLGGGPVNVEQLLSIRGVLIADEAENVPVDEVLPEVRKTLDQAIDALCNSRSGEGRRLADILAEQIDEISTIVTRIAAHPARTPEAIKARLAQTIERLTGTEATDFDPARLHQEAMLLATKADIEEELQRLSAHVEAARELLALKEPVGRRFDFLTQEFNREANTICSKSNHAEITSAGLELKTIVDRLREQVQNVE